jgi:predicted O-linked N-acetylglucosamine transferase (SPINDLY family)
MQPKNLSTGERLAQAYSLVGQQRYAEAEEGLKALLRVDPRNHAAIHLLALLACQFRRLDLAEPLASEAARLAPSVADYRVTLGRARKALDRLPEAETALRHAIQIDAGNADAHVLLGLVRKSLGHLDEAIVSYRTALALRPDFPEAQINLANALRERGEKDRAATLYEKAAAAAPDLAEAQSALAASLLGQGRRREALDQYRRALDLNPDQPGQQFVRGLLSQQHGGTSAEAIDAYSRVLADTPEHTDAWVNLGLALVDAGQINDALKCYQKALDVDPDHLEAHINFGLALSAFGANTEAIARLRHAVELRPDHLHALNNLGAILILEGRQAEAEEVLRRALALDPQSVQVRTNLGSALRGPGRQHESIELLRAVLTDDPDHVAAQDNLLLSMLYADGITAQEIVDAARAFGKPVSAGVPLQLTLADQGRRLRIGYVSPDLRRHSVAYFVEPVLARHDRNRFEIFCYHLSALEDDVSERLRGLSEHWFNAHGLPAAVLADRIRDDGIDILVDLAGRTGQHRLAAFAERPAPVQMTWLGFPSTVGLPAIEYRITDWQVDPAGYERFNTEKPVRLPHSYFCYRPGPAPDIGPMPSIANGHITFGSFNNIAKVSDAVLALWAGVLQAVPGSRLVLKNKMLTEAAVCARLRAGFSAAGIDPERLDLLAWLPDNTGHLDLYNRIDIALDTYPYNGATTTCEALWMGVPVVSRCGETHAARMGRSILAAAGLGECVAESDEAFIGIAAALAADHARRAALRAGLRRQLAASPLMDEAGFTAALEQCFLDTRRTATTDYPNELRA